MCCGTVSLQHGLIVLGLPRPSKVDKITPCRLTRFTRLFSTHSRIGQARQASFGMVPPHFISRDDRDKKDKPRADATASDSRTESIHSVHTPPTSQRCRSAGSTPPEVSA